MCSVGDIIVTKETFNDAAVSKYFSIANKDLNTLSYYDSHIWSWLRPGTYPAIIDVKGNVPDGALIGGSPGDVNNIAP